MNVECVESVVEVNDFAILNVAGNAIEVFFAIEAVDAAVFIEGEAGVVQIRAETQEEGNVFREELGYVLREFGFLSLSESFGGDVNAVAATVTLKIFGITAGNNFFLVSVKFTIFKSEEANQRAVIAGSSFSAGLPG